MLIPIEDAAAVLGVKRTTVYGLVSRGEVQTVHIGRRALVTADSLTDYIERLTGKTVERDGAA